MNTMHINDSQPGFITAVTGTKVSSLEYYRVGVHGTKEGEWVVHDIHSNSPGHGSAMMYHLCLLAEQSGITTLHATTVAKEAYKDYEKWGFAPDANVVSTWLALGITDPEKLKMAGDWYAKVSTVKQETQKRLNEHWKLPPSTASLFGAQTRIPLLGGGGNKSYGTFG